MNLKQTKKTIKKGFSVLCPIYWSIEEGLDTLASIKLGMWNLGRVLKGHRQRRECLAWENILFFGLGSEYKGVLLKFIELVHLCIFPYMSYIPMKMLYKTPNRAGFQGLSMLSLLKDGQHFFVLFCFVFLSQSFIT